MRRMMLAALFCTAVAAAQEQKIEKDVLIRRAGPQGGDVMFGMPAAPAMGARLFGFSPGAVKGAPYAAEAVTERVQVLPDGNRITEKSSSKQYRDSEGRTRMENTLGPTMTFVPASGRMSLVFIDDPVAGVHYTLHPEAKTAEKFQIPSMPRIEAGTQAKTEVRTETRSETITATITAGEPAMVGGPAVMVYSNASVVGGPNAPRTSINKTPLGKRIIEGVEADGAKTVQTIPAGAVGNDRPIEIISEVWYSNELKTDVLRKHNDPRYGETSFKLTSIIRGEQPRTLFEPPSDYKITDSPMRMRVERKP